MTPDQNGFADGKSGTRATVLLASASDADYARLSRIFHGSTWMLEHVRTCRQALNRIRSRSTPVVICGSELDDGDWRQILGGSSVLAPPPALIVTSRLADDRLWAEVLNVGGFDVLAQPFDRTEVVRVVSSAWRQWTHQERLVIARERTAQYENRHQRGAAPVLSAESHSRNFEGEKR